MTAASPPGRVTVVGHDASRTGAPIALAALLEWVARHEPAQVSLLLVRGGPLVERYRRTTPTRVLGAISTSVGRASRGVESVVGDRVDLSAVATRLALRREPTADVVVANTLAALATSTTLARRGGRRARLVCHVHELDGVAQRLLPADAIRRARLLAEVDRFVATGPDVAEMLTRRLLVPPERVVTVDAAVVAPVVADGETAAVRRQLTAGEDRPVVLSVGAMIRRKGPERFVDLMAALVDHPTRPVGVWLGGDGRQPAWGETVHDVDRSGAAGSIRLVASLERPAAYLGAADLLVSTAVEDPFPLSVLEAAALGTPVVGFDSGGLSHVLGSVGQGDQVCGVGDLFALRGLVGAALDDPAARRRRGEALSDWVRSTHLVDQIAPQWWSAVCG